MTGIYVVEMLDVLTDAGCRVAENVTTDGWERRARASGGFPSTPLGVQWHHTASVTSPENDLAWQINGCDDAPVGNLLLDRTGTFWPVAAGAANTAGKGGPLTLSRGTIPADSANTRTFAFEVANAGAVTSQYPQGEPWPVAQIDAYFAGSNALNAHFGNLPTDVFSHALGEGDGWTSRKVDPARAEVVEGAWRPRSVNSSGTWALADIRAECSRRASNVTPNPPTPEVPDMSAPAVTVDATGAPWVVWLNPADCTLAAKCGDDDPFGLGTPEGVELTQDIAVVPGGDGLYVWVYAADGRLWLRHWSGRGRDWDPWYVPV